MKHNIRMLYALSIMLFLFNVSACGLLYTPGVLTRQGEIVSPSGAFIARREDFVRHYEAYDVKVFRIHILDREKNLIYTSKFAYEAERAAFTLWADEEDVLWGKSESGLTCWVREDGRWIEFDPYVFDHDNDEIQEYDYLREGLFIEITETDGEVYNISLSSFLKETPSKVLRTPAFFIRKYPDYYHKEMIFSESGFRMKNVSKMRIVKAQE